MTGGGRPPRDRALSAAMGATIRAMRLDRGLLQQELAARVGISSSALSRIETGGRGLTIPRLLRLSAALEVGYWQIIEGDWPPHASDRPEDV